MRAIYTDACAGMGTFLLEASAQTDVKAARLIEQL